MHSLSHIATLGCSGCLSHVDRESHATCAFHPAHKRAFPLYSSANCASKSQCCLQIIMSRVSSVPTQAVLGLPPRVVWVDWLIVDLHSCAHGRAMSQCCSKSRFISWLSLSLICHRIICLCRARHQWPIGLSCVHSICLCVYGYVCSFESLCL